MAGASPARLPRGRHGLSREQVAADQRIRILLALAETMAEKGYVATTVADVLKRAGVSRETFYQQFSSKQDAFMAAFDAAGSLALAALTEDVAADADPVDRFTGALRTYLANLVAQPALARMFLVEVYAAGPEAIARRAAFQRGVVETMVGELGENNRFASELVVAGTAALVTPLLVAGDLDSIPELEGELVASFRRLLS